MSEHVPPLIHRNDSNFPAYPTPGAVASPYLAGFGDEEDDSRPQLLRLLKGVLRYKWILVLSGILGAAAATYSYRSIAPQYRADGAIWVNLEDRDSRTGPISQGGLFEQGAWIDLLRSFAVLEPVVEKERLYVSVSDRYRPLFQNFELAESFLPGLFELSVSDGADQWTLSTPDGVQLGSGVAGDSIGVTVGFLWAPPPEAFQPGTSIQFRVINPRDAARALSDQLQPQMDRQGNFLRLGLTGTNPERLARILRAIMEQHVAVAAELKKGKLDELTLILNDQLTQVQRELQGAENQLESFKVHTITLPSEESGAIAPGLQQTRDPVFSEFFNRRLELETISRDLERLGAILDSVPSGEVRVESFELVPAVKNSSQLQLALTTLTDRRAELRSLLQRYTEDYQPVRDLQNEIENL